MISALIFDFDGVIADTEPIHYRAFQEVLEPEKMTFPWEEYLGMYIGFDDRDAFRERYKNSGKKVDDRKLSDLIQKKAAAFSRLVTHAGVKPYPGVVELIALAGDKKIPVALCSGALRSDIEPVLAAVGLAGAFAQVVTADDVAVSKPDPTSYKLVVQKLGRGIVARNCIAIEDTPAGIAAAKAAGLKVVAVTNSHGRDKLFRADRIVNTLVGFKL
jgi:HAD superfamily hydrolase (TIGR01509 family)